MNIFLPKIKGFKKFQGNLKIYPEKTYEYKMNFYGYSKRNKGGLSSASAVIYKNDIEIWADSLIVDINDTNNHVEYAGLLLGLNKAFELGIKQIVIESDSMSIIKQMNGECKIHSDNLIDLYIKSKNLIHQFPDIKFNHICRNENKRAEELSNIAIQFYEFSFHVEKKTI